MKKLFLLYRKADKVLNYLIKDAPENDPLPIDDLFENIGVKFNISLKELRVILEKLVKDEFIYFRDDYKKTLSNGNEKLVKAYYYSFEGLRLSNTASFILKKRPYTKHIIIWIIKNAITALIKIAPIATALWAIYISSSQLSIVERNQKISDFQNRAYMKVQDVFMKRFYVGSTIMF